MVARNKLLQQDSTYKLERYKRRYKKAYATALLWWPILEAVYHYCVPGRNLFYVPNQIQGQQRNVRVYDTTQVDAAKDFVANMQASFCPPGMKWCEFEAGTLIPAEYKQEFDAQLKQATDLFFAYVHSSNFDVAIHEFLQDMVPGTGAVTCDDGGSDKNPLRYGSIPLSQLAIEQSITGKAETCFRTWGDVRIEDIRDMWPNARLTSQMKQNLQDDPTAVAKSLVEAQIYNHGEDLPYTYCLWSSNDILLEEKSISPTILISRFSKVNVDVFGRGPGIEALPSIMSLQTMAYFEMTASNLNICKPYMAYSDGIFNANTFSMAPNTIIPVAPSSSGQFPIQPLPDVSNVAFMQMTSGDLRQQIKKLMYADPLPPPDQKGQPKSATEVQIRQNNFLKMLGPTYTRLQQEWMEPIVNRTLFVLQRRGLIHPIVIDGKEIAIRYKSPLTISQGQEEVQTFLGFMQSLAMVVGPERAAGYIDPYKTHLWIGEKMGVNMSLLKSEDDVKEMFKQENEQQQNLLEMQEQQQNARSSAA